MYLVNTVAVVVAANVEVVVGLLPLAYATFAGKTDRGRGIARAPSASVEDR